MEWWVWLIVGVLFFAAMISAGWYGFSVWELKIELFMKNKEHKWYTKLKSKDAIKLDKIDDLNNDDQKMIILMVVGKKWRFKDEFLPLQLISTSNLKKELLHIKNGLNDNKKLLDYLQFTNQSIEDIKFYILEIIKDDQETNNHLHNWKKTTQITKKPFV
ncbi:hypothetical protein [Williamsoniiplasma luminosum]|uniref:Uncharacterized protein n=1 Tax=Williamsoniiplasma luminosum TaxID=214888 RepID=A0A2S0NKD9_9MOLU|nr:hypothetical protein [Williamsoniiplasma luminosum]AVP49465.1 MAG: hypothetical protein C5T88_02715 [Williamsoniiplasma luminosum]